MTLIQSKADYFDAIIVGAGPSGSSCAVHLSRMGLRVLLVDREHFPRDKVCGDGVSGKSMSMLRELGLIEEIELLPHVKIPDLELTSPDGTDVDITLQKGTAVLSTDTVSVANYSMTPYSSMLRSTLLKRLKVSP